MIASVDWGDVAYGALAVFLVLAGLAVAYGAIRLGGTLGRASSLIEGTEASGATWQDAVKTGKEEAARREQDLADDLGRADVP
jgi:hypothetical protein